MDDNSALVSQRKALSEEISHWKELVPQITASRDLRLAKESPESAKLLSSIYSSNSGDFGIGFCKGTHLENLEKLIWESFIKEDYGNELHLFTLRDEKESSKVTGYIFWRDISPIEMHKWVNTHELPNKQNSNQLISNSNSIFHHWMKVELLCTHPQYLGRKVGSILLASALLWAIQAGGKLNVPALKVYHRFQFEAAPKRLFNPPNDDLYVLLDIRKALESIDWNSMFVTRNEIEDKIVPQIEMTE